MTHDRREEQAMMSIMNAVSSRGKGKQGKIPDITDLYDRHSMDKPKEIVDVFEQQKEAMEWLSNFNINTDKEETDNEEESEVEEDV